MFSRRLLLTLFCFVLLGCFGGSHSHKPDPTYSNPNLDWFGWYRVVGKDYDSNGFYTRDYDHYTEALPYMNVVVVYDRGPVFMQMIFDKIQRTSADRVRWVIDMRRYLFDTVPSVGGALGCKLVLKSDHNGIRRGLREFREEVFSRGITHKVLALMIADEPYWNALTQGQLELAITMCEMELPEFYSFIVFSAHAMKALGEDEFVAWSNGEAIPKEKRNLPRNLDLISLDDGYNFNASFDSLFIPGFNKVFSRCNLPIFVTFQSMGAVGGAKRTDEVVALTQRFYDLAKSTPRVIGLLGWPYADFDEQDRPGAVTLMRDGNYRRKIEKISAEIMR